MAKTTIQVALTAGTTNSTSLNGKNIEFAPNSGELLVSITASAVGCSVQFYAGNDEVLEQSPVSAQNRVPLVPDDLALNEVIIQSGTKLRPVLSNPTGGTVTFFMTVEVTSNSPLAQLAFENGLIY